MLYFYSTLLLMKYKDNIDYASFHQNYLYDILIDVKL